MKIVHRLANRSGEPLKSHYNKKDRTAHGCVLAASQPRGLTFSLLRGFTLLVLGFGFLLTACSKTERQTAAEVKAVVTVRTATVQRMDMVDTVRIYGRVELRHEVRLASQFDGRLSEFSLLLGDRVHKGQKIGEIVPPAREALLQALPQVDPKLRPLLEQHVKSIPLLSPIDGVVLKVFHKQGDVVQKGEPVVHIGDLRVLDVRGDLPVEYLPVARGLRQMTVRFLDFPHPPVTLPVKAISGQADKTKQTVPIRLELRNPRGRFRAGLLVQIIFPGAEHKNTLAIPRTALLEEEGVYSAFVIKDGHAFKRRLKVGIRLPAWVEVLNGLQEGEVVATEKAYSLVDGMEVRVR